MGYAELHCHTNFSFLDGASHPEELVEEAARLGPRRRSRSPTTTASTGSSASRWRPGRSGLPTVFGAELTLGVGEAAATATADPPGSTSWCSPTGRSGTPASPARSAGASSRGRRRRPASPSPRSPTAPARRRAPHRQPRERAQRQLVRAHRLPQGRGARARCSPTAPPRRARALDRLVDAFGRDRVLVELWDHGDPLDRHRNDALATVADARRRRRGRHQQRALRHARAPSARHRARGDPGRRSLDELDGWLPASPLAHLRSAGRAAPSLRALARRGRAHASRSRSSARSTCGSPRPNLPDLEVPDGPHRHVVAARAHPPRRGACATRRRTRSTSRRSARSRTSST